MNEPYEHIVEYAYYCKKCKHKNVAGHEEPCNTCLENPTNLETRRPVNYEEDK